MPAYSFKCPDCGEKAEKIMTMAEVDTMVVLCKCRGVGKGTVMNRDFQADLFHTASDRYTKVIISDSLAISMDQIADHKAQFPDIGVTNEGQLVFDKFSTHEKYLKDTNHIKHPGKCRRKAKQITV
jgi:hypothetical protein